MIANILWWTLKGSAICAIAGVTTLFLRRSPAAVRHALWTVAIYAQLVVPFSGALIPRHRLEVQLPASTSRLVTSLPSTPAPAGTPTPAPPRVQWPSILIAVAIAGTALAVARLLAGTITMIATSLRASRVTEGEWLSAVQTRCEELSLSRPVTLLWTSRLTLPVTWGFLYPVILLPLSATEWSAERRDHVLLHELAHIKRADALSQLAAQLALALYWFNPMVWLAVRRMRAEAENACDDYVLRGGERPSAYATTLVRLVEAHRGAAIPAFASLAVGSRSDLEQRVAALTRTDRDSSIRRALLATSVACMLAVVVPLSAIQRALAPERAPSSTATCRSLTAPDFAGEMSGTLTLDSGVTTHYFFLRPSDDRCIETSFALDARFTDDDRDLAPAQHGAALVREKRDGVDRAAYITDTNGVRNIRYTVDGKPSAWNASAQRWYHDLMPEMVERTTAGALPRARRFLDDGFSAFAREVHRIEAPSVRYEYLVAALALRSPQELRRERLIALAESALTFEPERAKFLARIAAREALDTSLAREVLRATFALRHHADEATVFEALLTNDDPAVRSRALDAMERMPEEWRTTLLARTGAR